MVLGGTIGVSHGSGNVFTSLYLIGPNVKLLPSRFSTQDLVELLKQPLCVGTARRVVLDQLENRCQRKFADHWEFVAWAEKHQPGLDLTSPPKRPTFPAVEKKR